MIIFSTNFDEQTLACHNMIQNLNVGSAKILSAGDAVKITLETELSAAPGNIFAMTHGRTNALIGNDSNPAIDLQNSVILKDLTIFAFACHTSAILGKEVSGIGGTWFGYIGPIGCPDSKGDGLEIFKPIFQFIYDNYQHVRSVAQCNQFISDLKTLCDLAEEQVDAILFTSEDVGLSSFLCLKNTWERLRVWIANEATSIAHPNATEPLVF
ncbi:hypothetical protein KP001_08550 [Geomonas subterranea]|uniref:CHAT domain-containing protein n=1 Tax=Geomonas subterranea TaxID=2847989 RepID=A0ABX8LST4_9BACT|nr:hypothetical protein [Geomonas subterranea]QXE92550.1 hypothetical protein KP001_08550 [Geomonas subterranea]QXM09352.1 hypothetical protein KP002_20725 [Geomonas subterranea]